MRGQWLDVEMCPDCGEHCSIEEEEEEKSLAELQMDTMSPGLSKMLGK